MFIYLAILLVFAISSFHSNMQSRKYNNIYTNIKKENDSQSTFIIASIILIIIFAFRNVAVGTDTQIYSTYYEFYTPFKNKYEFLYEVILSFCKSINLSFSGLLFVCGIILFLSFANLINKYSSDKMFSLFLFVSLGIYVGSFNGLRQYLACAVFLFSIKYIFSKSFFKYAICIVIANLFHSSAILLIFVYFLRYIKLNKITIALGIVIIILSPYLIEFGFIVLSSISNVDYYNHYYITKSFASPISAFNIIYALVMFIMFFVFYAFKNKIKDDRKNIYNFFLKMYFIFACIRLIASFSEYFSLINRFTIYFYFSIIIILPDVIASLPKRHQNVAELITYCLTIIYFIISASIRQSNNLYPYIFAFNSLNVMLVACYYSVLLLCASIIFLSFKRKS